VSPIHTGVQSILDDLKRAKGTYRVLEAGCGSLTHLDLGSQAKVTGIDISQKQLDRNDNLNEKILGDVETHPLAPDTYDVIVSWDVLEHLAHPRLAIDNFIQAVSPGGLVILKLPNLLSLKGLVTRYTPHGFHVWFYRTYYKRPNAGRDDQAPFKTYLTKDVSPVALRRYAEKAGIEITHEAYDEATIQKRIKRMNLANRLLLTSLGKFLWLISLGAISCERTEYLIVLRKAVVAEEGRVL